MIDPKSVKPYEIRTYLRNINSLCKDTYTPVKDIIAYKKTEIAIYNIYKNTDLSKEQKEEWKKILSLSAKDIKLKKELALIKRERFINKFLGKKRVTGKCMKQTYKI